MQPVKTAPRLAASLKHISQQPVLSTLRNPLLTPVCVQDQSFLRDKQVFSTFSLQPVGATHLLCIRDTFQGTREIKVQPLKSSVPDSETVYMWHLRDGTDWPQDETKSPNISRDFIHTTAQTANPHKRQDIRLFSRRNLGGNNILCCLRLTLWGLQVKSNITILQMKKWSPERLRGLFKVTLSTTSWSDRG